MAALVIALIEDTEQGNAISNCLQDAGHRVLVIENFTKAKACLRDCQCDLILSDVHLQNGGNVFDFIKWVRSKPLLKPIPFVLLSIEPSAMAKYLCDGVRVASRYFGASKYISLETFDPANFMSELSEFLAQPEPASLSSTDQIGE